MENKGSEVVTDLWYLKRLPLYDTQKPYFINFPVPSDGKDVPPQHNVLHEQVHDISITDIRGHESDFVLDTHGFELDHHETSLTNEEFEIDHIVREKYYPEIVAFISKKLGASRVVPFEHTHRLSQPLSKGCGCSRKRKPLVAAHVDQTPASSAQRIRYHLGDEADHLLKNRFQVINVWRPLFGPLRDFPLTLGDFSTFDLARDGEPTDLVFPHYVGESLNLYHHPAHRWYYYSDQMRDQVWVFKCHDSRTDVARAAPHCSFDIQNGIYTERFRESIEIRLLVMYDE